MDSPLIVDGATRFGRGLDLDRDFPGFPFDDDGGFGHRSDIRSHLDNLAARHPEFADHLIGPPWADIPFGAGNTGSLHRNRHRPSSSERANNQSDEDTRSQASGSSAGSEADQPLGHKQTMENPQQQQQQSRNIRAMSAPPDNRQNAPQTEPNGRFVSRVDFTPQSPNQQTNNQSQPQPQQQQHAVNGQREQSPGPQQPTANQSSQQQKTQQPQGNVRHIPIFVEGRDSPVVPKEVDETDFQPRRREQSPPQFHRPSHYQQHYKHPPGWSFQDPFFEQPRWGSPPQHSPFQSRFAQEKPQTQQNWHNEPPQHQPNQRHQPQSQPQAAHPHTSHPQASHSQAPHPQQHQKQPQQEEQAEPPKPRQQVQPKDPLEKVALIQDEINSLAEQVKNYKGNSRQEKEYMYLDEMLTRELIKLDDIETEGKDNVRQARKQAIKSIQESISLLESKAPLPSQQQNECTDIVQYEKPESTDAADVNEKADEPMDTLEVQTTTAQLPLVEDKPAAIPLPAPDSLCKTAETPTTQSKQGEEKSASHMETISNQEKPAVHTESSSIEGCKDKAEKIPKLASETTDNSTNPNTSAGSVTPIKLSPVKELISNNKSEIVKPDEAKEKKKEAKEKKADLTSKADAKLTKAKKEPPPVPEKPGKSPKKAKKTKKPPGPVSETAIPLPAPGQTI